ncbi:zinc finger BED domain-containing protein RICESLEEPER 2-like [Pyrus x bretschneideri]|uniref:zinc finger BED domain-containing protein RICESLEEPER 2-like n=1 Tax=Pyrus x bretschneideri TaxID=225117 RepID=UPI00202F3482|nr:zinc finger BED domain-containing protein RICESLEEPER 2-like [Pyrus x bretschneideri]
MDTWTSIQQTNYTVLTAHFIDDDWMLHKKILNFCVILNHKGESIAQLLEECLVEWGIEKVLTIMVDNASANDSSLRYLVHRISGRGIPNALLHDGKYLNMRCVAHILNLVVNDGIKMLNTAIQSIRNAVRYGRSSPQRLESFTRLKVDDGHYFPFFTTENHDNIREGPPSTHDWSKVVDYYELLYGKDEEKVEIATNAVKDLLFDLYKIHEELFFETQQSTSSGGSSQSATISGDPLSSMTEIERKLKEKSEMRKAKRARIVHNDFDRYLSDPNEREEEANFDILNWWRVNRLSKYPILAQVTKEILAIPVSTIASESSLSTSGRIIDPYRSSLSPKMVEALICTRNCLRSIHVALHHEPTIEEIEFCEEVEKEMASGSSKKGAMLPLRLPKR